MLSTEDCLLSRWRRKTTTTLLTAEQIDQLHRELGIRPGEEWARFPPASPEGRLCDAVGDRLRLRKVQANLAGWIKRAGVFATGRSA